MGRAEKKPEPEHEDAKVLPASVALSLIWGGPPDEEEDEASGRGEEPVGDPDRSEGARDPASPKT
jgi:hypothetical protein